ncbi:MAG: hypothetical protein RLP02_34960, partial [Coleofasciculus sp. C2-GNP5-27]
MMFSTRWDPCVAHFDENAHKFIGDYFHRDDVKPLLVAGAGFDPRSRIVAELLTGAGGRLLLIKEQRANPDAAQVAQ